LEFAGDVPVFGSYVFRGGGVEIQTVLYRGESPASVDALYNSENSNPTQPRAYYTVRFYASLEALSRMEAPLGSALICEGVIYYRIDTALNGSFNGSSAVREGAIPSFPEGTNLWFIDTGRLGVAVSLADALSYSVDAYAVASNYNDLAFAALSIEDKSYNGENDPPKRKVYSSENFEILSQDGYYCTYYRKNASGAWEESNDLTAIGDMKVIVTGTGRFHGSKEAFFKIDFMVGGVFTIRSSLTGGDSDTVPTYVTIGTLDRSAKTGTLVFCQTTEPKPRKAVSYLTSGELYLSSGTSLCGWNFATTGIGDAAFGLPGSDASSSKEDACTRLAAVHIPATITAVGAGAFRGCVSLEKVVFEGDAATISFADNLTFADAAKISQVIYRGPKETKIGLFPSSPTRYYTLRFYEKSENTGTDSALLGQATVSEKLPLCFVASLGDGTGLVSVVYPNALYDGVVPAYPDWAQDDGRYFRASWVFPGVGWRYPEAPQDQYQVLSGGLSDSTVAYAERVPEAYTVEDALVFGLRPGQTMPYTGYPVLDASDLIICAATGGLLSQDVNYEITFERATDAGEWQLTEDLINPGSLRAVITGIGSYATLASAQRIPFRIYATALPEGTQFSVAVPLTAADGTQNSTACRFIITSAALDAEEVCVYSAGDTQPRAIDITASGRLEIPATVRYAGVDYKVTALSAYAIGSTTATRNPGQLTEVVLPDTLTEVGDYALARLTSLTRLDIPGSVRAFGQYAFAYNNALADVTLGEGIVRLSDFCFLDTSMIHLTLPSTLESIAANTFLNNTRLAALDLPAALNTYTGAFNGCTRIARVAIAEGASAVPDEAFRNLAALKELSLPSTLRTIGKEAFLGTSLERIVVPASARYLGNNCFSSCQQLTYVEFLGDARLIEAIVPFTASRQVAAVVFADKASDVVRGWFSGAANVTFWYALRFYDSPEAQQVGTNATEVVVRAGTLLRDIRDDRISSDDI
jgi:hypothetical protein